jgi:hypothetical protein
MDFRIPASIKEEHDELHGTLKRLIGLGGKTGEMAAKVEQVMRPHFLKEEEFALPPLGLLPELAKGEQYAEMAVVFPLTDTLKRNLPYMVAEHSEIVKALHDLEQGAMQEGKDEAIQFSRTLQRHAREEEEIQYPAAILVGEYLHRVLK